MQTGFHIRWEQLKMSSVIRWMVHVCLLSQFHFLRQEGWKLRVSSLRNSGTTVAMVICILLLTNIRKDRCLHRPLPHPQKSPYSWPCSLRERMQSLPTEQAAGRVGPHLPPFSSPRWNRPQQQTLWSTLPATTLRYLSPPSPSNTAPTAVTHTHRTTTSFG